MRPKHGHFGFESFGLGDQAGYIVRVSQSEVHESFVSSGGFSANSLETSEESNI